MNDKLKINTSSLHFIGYSVDLSSTEIIVRVPHYNNLDKFMKNNNLYNDTSINTFVIIESHNYFFIGIIEKENMSSHDVKSLISDDTTNNNELNDKETPEIYIKILSEINPVNLNLVNSTWHFPVIGSRVYLSDNVIIKSFIKNITNKFDKPRTNKFAQLLQNNNINVNLSFNNLFSKHLAIVGSTGSGKSYTAAKLILNLEKSHQRIVLLDPTGEYENIIDSFREDLKRIIEDNYNISGKDIYGILNILFPKFDVGRGARIPYFDLNDNELYQLLHPSTGLQFPIVKLAIRDLEFNYLLHYLYKNNNRILVKLEKIDKTGIIEKIMNDGDRCIDYVHKFNNKTLYKNLQKCLNIDFHNHKFGFHFNDLLKQIKNECYQETKNNYRYIRFDSYTWNRYCLSLVDRIHSFLINKSYSKYFCNIYDQDSGLLHALTYNSINTSFVTYINLKHVSLSRTIPNVIGDYFARKILTAYIKHQISHDSKNNPVVLFLDEAHNFIQKYNKYDELHLEYFNLIAKEGRKYGLFMTLITQDPSDLSQDILSQFGTFIIHHLSNSKQRQQISNVLPYNSNLNKFIPSLNTGNAIISSNDLYSPLLVTINKIKDKRYRPKSSTPKF